MLIIRRSNCINTVSGTALSVSDRPVADDCECGNEPSGSIKCGEFLD